MRGGVRAPPAFPELSVARPVIRSGGKGERVPHLAAITRQGERPVPAMRTRRSSGSPRRMWPCQGRAKSGPLAPVEKWTTLGLGESPGETLTRTCTSTSAGPFHASAWVLDSREQLRERQRFSFVAALPVRVGYCSVEVGFACAARRSSHPARACAGRFLASGTGVGRAVTVDDDAFIFRWCARAVWPGFPAVATDPPPRPPAHGRHAPLWNACPLEPQRPRGCGERSSALPRPGSEAEIDMRRD
jgi:hypothetical protein